jgi:nucleoside-diphosphate-sugar epimerase
VPEFVWLTAPIGEDPDKRDYLVSNEKMEKTGWRPDYTLELGIRELIRGYRMVSNARYSNV